MVVSMGSGVSTVTKAATFANSIWYHMMVTILRTAGSGNSATRTVTLYQNGISLGSSTISQGEIESPGMIQYRYYGTDSIGNGFTFNGDAAVFYVYDIELSAAEVLQNFNAQKSRYGY
jgi:hypothetical protein